MKINKTIITTGLLVTGLSILSIPKANAETHCYRFNSPAVGTIFEAGKSLNTKNAVVNFLQLRNSINVGYSSISNSNILDNSKPSLSIGDGGASNVQFIPHRRVQSVTMRYAEAIPPVNNPQGWNLGMNNKILKWNGRLSDQHGVRAGKSKFGGRVLISVEEELNAPSSGWVEGKLTLTSDPAHPARPDRGIGMFEIGRTSQLLIDDVCMSH